MRVWRKRQDEGRPAKNGTSYGAEIYGRQSTEKKIKFGITPHRDRHLPILRRGKQGEEPVPKTK